MNHWNGQIVELLGWTDSRKEEKSTGIYCAGAEDRFCPGGYGELLSRFERHVDTPDRVIVDVEFARPGIGDYGKIGSLLVAT